MAPGSWRGSGSGAPAAGITYGLYLTISSWVLYVVTTKSQFFHDHVGLFSLNTQQGAHPSGLGGNGRQDQGWLLGTCIAAKPAQLPLTRRGAAGGSSGSALLSACMRHQQVAREHPPHRPCVPCCRAGRGGCTACHSRSTSPPLNSGPPCCADHLVNRCLSILREARLDPAASLCQVPQYTLHTQCGEVDTLTQCVGEQLYVRDSIVRALMYLQARTDSWGVGLS